MSNTDLEYLVFPIQTKHKISGSPPNRQKSAFWRPVGSKGGQLPPRHTLEHRRGGKAKVEHHSMEDMLSHADSLLRRVGG